MLAARPPNFSVNKDKHAQMQRDTSGVGFVYASNLLLPVNEGLDQYWFI
jgi:hypothetical protein